MALFDIFKKRNPSVPLPQLCYDIAYFILPRYAYSDFAKLHNMCRETPTAAGPFFYVMACQMRKIEPDTEVARSFTWHVGKLANSLDYLTLSYPTPPPVEMSDLSPEELMNSKTAMVLAPHFSCVLRDGDDHKQYFVLGQSPMGGGTTLRCITPDGRNCNLGPGPAPTMDELHSVLESRAKAE